MSISDNFDFNNLKNIQVEKKPANKTEKKTESKKREVKLLELSDEEEKEEKKEVPEKKVRVFEVFALTLFSTSLPCSLPLL